MLIKPSKSFEKLKKAKEMAPKSITKFWKKLWPFKKEKAAVKTRPKDKTLVNPSVGSVEVSDAKFVKKVYGGESLHDAITRSEIVFGRNKPKYRDFQQSLLDPTLISPEEYLALPESTY